MSQNENVQVKIHPSVLDKKVEQYVNLVFQEGKGNAFKTSVVDLLRPRLKDGYLPGTFQNSFMLFRRDMKDEIQKTHGITSLKKVNEILSESWANAINNYTFLSSVTLSNIWSTKEPHIYWDISTLLIFMENFFTTKPRSYSNTYM